MWQDPGWHGTPDMRLGAFLYGLDIASQHPTEHLMFKRDGILGYVNILLGSCYIIPCDGDPFPPGQNVDGGGLSRRPLAQWYVNHREALWADEGYRQDVLEQIWQRSRSSPVEPDRLSDPSSGIQDQSTKR